MKRMVAVSLIAVMATFGLLIPFVYGTDSNPVDFKDPRSLAGNFWFVKNVKGTLQYLGSFDSDIEIAIYEAKSSKKAGESIVTGKFRNTEKIHKFDENADIDSKVKIGKDGFPEFTFANRAGNWLKVRVLLTGDLVLSGGGLSDVTLKLAVSNTEAAPEEKETTPAE